MDYGEGRRQRQTLRRGVLVAGDNTKSGKFSTAVIHGDVCVETGAAVPGGDRIALKAGKTVKENEASARTNIFGFAPGATDAAGDTVLIYFRPLY